MNMMEQLAQPIWDSASFVEQCELFHVPVGQGHSIFTPSRPKGFADTNMVLANQLAAGWEYILCEVRCEGLLGTVPADLAGLVLKFWIGSKTYLDLPAETAALRLTLEEHNAGLLLPGMSFGFELGQGQWLHVRDCQAFGCTLLAADQRRRSLRVSLHGILRRAVQ